MATKKNNFEEQLNELQEIVNKLESGNVPLEDALNEFQAGVKSVSYTHLLFFLTFSLMAGMHFY